MSEVGAKTAGLQAIGWERFKITATRSNSDCLGEWLIAAKNVNEAVVEFVCYEIPSASDYALFLKEGWNCSSELIDDPIEAEVFMSGIVKWDGDCQWEAPNGLCFYGHKGARSVGKLIEEIVGLAESMLSNADF